MFFQIGRTERIDDNLNPKFQKQITVDYHFEEVQKLAFYLFDIDDNNNDVSKADFLGKCECTLGQVFKSCLIKASMHQFVCSIMASRSLIYNFVEMQMLQCSS
jgi:hypothetical protein